MIENPDPAAADTVADPPGDVTGDATSAAPSDSAGDAAPPGDDLDDGYAPDESVPDVVDDLEDRVLHEENSPVLDVEQDADAQAVQRDPEHSGDEAQPPT